MPFYERGPVRIRYEETGSGFPLLLIPGGGLNSAPVAALRRAAGEPVGSSPELRGAFGQDDLAGGVIEWTFDWYSERYYLEGGRDCLDCANTREEIARVVRGAKDTSCCSGDLDTEYRAAARSSRAPGVLLPGVGARCARDVPR